ncbi:MAG: hypothetical protein A2700_00950 [Candidatus Blackburnbacteria bacterium RIFCSPHIGHO2_01_FULL_44_64]|uniref:Aspartyl protease n=2 Tax=Microgenomates group TaxID=1794810 RepID=A0A0G1TG94_9BACT|nr:MAG: hypothetical protein UY08_C0008G0004 [Candidatus Gottesmanbacteria bacterium GW2011_GWA1_47_8]OGY08391.1 MAG: hypothetical protein A2700_00950 [Candidatus Blackburnbacteria bacterium RIFCSPHIGHO2_01_FULL_44_64]OGY10885.1 MAG: hypothetical protein A3E16_03185 [Candidatus Blackburnbacteria bacterium RIFCSPHIGHO2_12_FULL_44_25]OGY10911.1 MAG: hypothetical protein A3D26_01755 [Candidatus Blackburnbacteria bacterium RIFCSPHIGHO2_02_FULL_44_20]OGY13815.1 MAG: hypothetical protein A3A62_00665 
MGMTSVKLQIRNLQKPDKKAVGEFLVDSGAFFTVVPEKMVKDLGLKPERTQEFSLADGKTIKRKLGNALIKFRNDEIAVPVVLGEKDDSPLMGALTLEAMGLMLDPFSRKLYPAKLTL